MNGLINIYKEKGFTSHDVVAIARKKLGTKKIGHTGTLDPDAEGVLTLCIGNATKAVEYLTNKNKEYVAIIKLGIITDTQDISGNILNINKDFNIKTSEIEEVINLFKGEIKQIPPMYSAIKVNGKKLYELAREGKVIDRKPRKITIKEIEVLDIISKDEIKIRVLCSKGTYIRTLCNDIGEKLGCGATMKYLLRTKVDKFSLQDCVKLEELDNIMCIKDKVIKTEDIFYKFEKKYINEKGIKYLKNGNKLTIEMIENYKDFKFERNDLFRIYDINKEFKAIYIVDNEYTLKPDKMFL